MTSIRLHRAAQISALLLILVGILVGSGCSSTKPLPAPSVAVQKARRLEAIAEKHTQMKNWRAAAPAWQEAADASSLVNDRGQEAMAIHNSAVAQRKLGKLPEARQLFETAAQINLDLALTEPWCFNQLALAQLDAQQNDLPGCQKRLDQMHDKLPPTAPPRLQGLLFNEYGQLHLLQTNLDASSRSLQQALLLFIKANDRPGQAAVTSSLAWLEEQRKSWPAATQHWRVALAHYEALGDPDGIASALCGLGRTLYLGDLDVRDAVKKLSQAAHNFKLLQQPLRQKEALELLRSSLEKLGKTSEAENIQKEISHLSQPNTP
jgi:tetratricopeptide (TPR) repeat protein